MKIYIASIHHKHGVNLYAGATEAELDKKVADYVRDQGGPEEWCGSYQPEDQAEIDAMTDCEAIESYFGDHPSEYVEYQDDEVDPKVGEA